MRKHSFYYKVVQLLVSPFETTVEDERLNSAKTKHYHYLETIKISHSGKRTFLVASSISS